LKSLAKMNESFSLPHRRIFQQIDDVSDQVVIKPPHTHLHAALFRSADILTCFLWQFFPPVFEAREANRSNAFEFARVRILGRCGGWPLKKSEYVGKGG